MQEDKILQETVESPKPEMESNLTCSVFHSFEDVADLQEEWDALVESVGGDIYFTYDWCRTWWDVYGAKRQLTIYLFYQDEKLVGAVPVFYETLWLGPAWLKITKLVGADFTISMMNPPVQPEQAEEVFRFLFQLLIKEGGCDAVHLGPISGRYLALQPLRQAIRRSEGVAILQEKEQSPHTIFSLPDSFERYVQSLGKSQRSDVRRKLNFLSKSFRVSQDLICTETEAASEFGKFVEMHTRQWQSDGRLGHFGDWPSAEAFHFQVAMAQARRGRLRLVRLLADGHVVSYQLCYAIGCRWYWRIPARLTGPAWDRYSLGSVGFFKELEMAIEEGVKEIDAGAGHYGYKVKLGGREYPLYTFLLVRSSPWCRWRARTFRLFSSMLNFCYYRVWFGRLAPRLPLKRKPLWKLWIKTRL